MAIDSSSTLAEVQAQYDDNADYDTSASVAKAKLFIHAVRVLIRRTPRSTSQEGDNVTYQELRRELDVAADWLQAHDADSRPGPSVTRMNFNRMRDL